MPLKSGYSYETTHENIAQMISEGYTRAVAVAASYADARKSFFKAHPHGALPVWLAWPKKYRMREHYSKSGQAINNEFAENPAPVSEIAKAKKLFREFTGDEPANVVKLNVPQIKAGLAFGQLIQVGYKSARDGKLYRHTFRANKSRPLLIASSDGKSLLIVGGRYAFTNRGIEDR